MDVQVIDAGGTSEAGEVGRAGGQHQVFRGGPAGPAEGPDVGERRPDLAVREPIENRPAARRKEVVRFGYRRVRKTMWAVLFGGGWR